METPYIEITDGVKVAVRPMYSEENSHPIENIFAFNYTIHLENLGADRVQLIERHWVILSNGERIGEVIGPGVVGEQPVLAPGDQYEYTSGVVIHDPVGSMHGSYTFRSDGGRFFQVFIPEFDLVCPIMVH